MIVGKRKEKLKPGVVFSRLGDENQSVRLLHARRVRWVRNLSLVRD